MSSASTDQAFGPGPGPTIYLSYTHFDESARIMPEVVTRLQQSGFRAMTDQSWTPEMVADPVGTVRRLCEAADWRIAIATPTYLERAKTLGTGIRCDLDVIGRFIVDRPMTSIRNGVVVESSSGELPLELLGGGKSGWSRDLGVESLANAILNITDNPPETIDEPTPITQIWQSNWNRDMRRVLEMVGNASDKFKRPPDVTKLFAPLFLGDTAVTEIRLLPSSAYKMMERWLDDENERQWSAAFGPLRWASLAANTIAHSAPTPIHVAIGLLHAEAPWTEDVSTLLQSVQIASNQVRAILLSLAQRTQKIDALTDLVELAHRAFRLEGSSPELAFRTLDVPVRKRPVAKAPLTPNALPPLPPRPPTPSKLSTPLSDLAQPDRGYARLNPDLASGDDELGITGDVQALAKMIAAWNLEPPLAVGLFGDWGSGKTFFMGKLRDEVSALSKAARDRKHTLQKNEAFCKHIAQVEFNAWHYSEGDLWAAIVHHIFANLKIDPDEGRTELAKRQASTIAAIKNADGDVEKKAQALADSEREVADKERVKQEAERTAEEAVRTLAVTATDVVEVLRTDPELRERARTWLRDAGIDDSALKTGDEVHKALVSAKDKGMTTFNLTRQLWRDFSTRRGRTIGAFALMAGLPLGMAYAMTNSTWMQTHVSSLMQSLMAIAPGVVTAATYFSSAAARLSHALDTPRRRIAEAHRERIATAQKAVDAKKAERNKAREELDEAKARAAKEREELQRLNPSHLLAEFLADRAGSKDYREKLGLLAMIRGDFDRLNTLMKEQRDADLKFEAAANDPANETPPPANDSTKINRIILYIDDLDRCPPDRVVKVLQAIHLLLAFRLFIVVVGVDARWVQRSLRKEFKLLLRGERGDPHPRPQSRDPLDDDEDDDQAIATPHDYLEKIFQIPLWLRPLDPNGQRKLLRALVKNDQVPTPPTTNSTANSTTAAATTQPTQTPRDQTPKPPPATNEAPNTSAVRSAPASNVEAKPLAVATPPAQTPATTASQDRTGPADSSLKANSAAGDKPKPPAPPDSLDHLRLDPAEIETLEQLSTLCGRSPRAIKRYVNCYRLFKAMLRESGTTPFAQPDASPGQAPHELAMLTLAIIVGAPATASKLIELVRNTQHDALPFDEALRSLEPGPDASDQERDEWLTIAPHLGNPLPTHPVSEARDIVFRVWRFSFRSGETPRKPQAAPAAAAE